MTINTLINLVNMSTNVILGIALAPYFIRSLGDQAYGLWVLIISLSVARGFLGIFDLGIQGSIVKYVAEYTAQQQQQRVNEVASAALVAYLLIGSLVAGGIGIFAVSNGATLFRIPPNLLSVARTLLLLLAAQTLFDFPAMAATGLLEGLERFDITRGFNIVRLFVFGALAVVLLHLGMGVYALALATFAGELLRLAGHLYWIRRLMPHLRLTWHIPKAVLKAIFNLSGKLFIFSLTITVYNQMDQFIISIMLTTTLLTDYDISNRLHTLVFALTTMIGPFMIAAASALNAQNNQVELHRLMVRATRYTAVLTVPAALIIIVLAEPLTATWIGPEYVHTVPATRLFVSYLLYWSLLRVGQNMLIGINKLSVILPAFMLSTLINLVVSVLAAPHLGVSGVILGTVVGNALACIPYLIAFKRELGMGSSEFLREVLLKVYPQALMGSVATALLLAWHRPSSLFQVGLYAATGMVVFLAAFVLTGMPLEERAMLGRYTRQILHRSVQLLGRESR